MHNQAKPGRLDWTLIKLIKWATAYFDSHHIDSPRTTAEILLAHAISAKRIDLYLRYDQPLNSDELNRFKTLIKRRRNREPVAYILQASCHRRRQRLQGCLLSGLPRLRVDLRDRLHPVNQLQR